MGNNFFNESGVSNMGFFSRNTDKSSKYFDKNTEPSCSYCGNGKRISDGTQVFCKIVGPVSLKHSCNKFQYSPLKRVPVKQINIPGNFDDTEEASAE
jgi:hypothetical protein